MERDAPIAPLVVDIRVLGGFTITVDGDAHRSWPRRTAGSLVKLLALSADRRLHRERVIDALWPDVTLDRAAPRLHKAAHYARRTLASDDAVVLRGDSVALFPSAAVRVDLDAFERAAEEAMRSGDADDAIVALDLYAGDLLPDDLYEPWSSQPRERAHHLHLALLRAAGRWEQLLTIDELDEGAHLALLRMHARAGDRTATLRQFDHMERVLREELGIDPPPEAIAIRDRMRTLPSTRAGSDAEAAVTRAPDETLIERSEAGHQLDAAFTEAQRGLGAVILVSGEAGIGKTALVRSFTTGFGTDVTVLAGGCEDLLTPSTFGPLSDVARGVPALRAALDDAVPGRVHEVLLELLGARPTVLVLEDVHWADDATLDTIRYLAPRVAGVPSLLLLTYRDEEVPPGHPLRQLLGALVQRGARRIQLTPLTAAGVETLAERVGVRAPELHRITRGNPFFVTEALASRSDEVPASVRDVVLARVDRLPDESRTLLARLSVVPSGVERSLADALCEGDATEALREPERAGVLVGDATTVSFRHEIARRALADSLTPAERTAHHARLAEILDARGSDPARVVHHAVQAHRDDLVVKAGIPAANQAARVGAHRQVAEHLHDVLQRMHLLTPAEKVDLLVLRADALQLANQFDESLRTAEFAVEVAESLDDDDRLALALLAAARTGLWARGSDAAGAVVRRALAVLGPHGDLELRTVAHADLARALSDLATISSVAEPNPEVVEHALIGVGLAEVLGRADLRARALTYLGNGRLALGDPQGSADLDEAIAVLRTFPRAEFAVRACVNASGACYRAGRFDDAERYVELGLAFGRDIEFLSGDYRLSLTRACVWASQGRWNAAEPALRELLDRAGDPGIMDFLTRSVLARLLARQGRFDDADAVFEPARTAAHRSVEVRLVGPVAAAALEIAWLRGETLPVPRLVGDALAAAARAGHTVSRAEIARYLQRAGQVAPVVDRAPEPWASGLRGDWKRAGALWERRSEPYEQALELLASGRAEPVAVGRRILRDLGATATLGVTRQAGT
jgi:DNA-binding SARP family transcriptional activator/tetratricopeptide (TPR) repeat protein